MKQVRTQPKANEHKLRPSTGDYCFVCNCGQWQFRWEDSTYLDPVQSHADHIYEVGITNLAAVRALAEEAAMSAHDLGMEPNEAPNADLAYEFMCDNVWNDFGESQPVNPVQQADMPTFRMWYQLHMLEMDCMTEVRQ